MSIRRMVTVRSLILVLAAVALAAFSCRKSEAPNAQRTAGRPGATTTAPADMRGKKIVKVIPTDIVENVTRSRLGSVLGPDGTVSADSAEFKKGDPIYLSMWFSESPGGLRSTAIWYEGAKQIADNAQEMKGAKVVTFRFNGKPLDVGKYRVVGFWGGNVAAEHAFSVIPMHGKR